jgi:uroporphyrinogen decarboxylase
LEEPDRVPVMDTLLSGFRMRYLKAHGLGDSVNLNDLFGFDIGTVSCTFTPPLEEPRVLERGEETEIYVDGWGLMVRRWIGRDGVPQVIRPAIGDKEELDGYFKDPEDEARFVGLERAIEGIHEKGLSVFFTISDHWGGLYHIFGLKNLLKLVHVEGDLVRETIYRLSAHYSKVLTRVLEEDVDAIWFFGDLATNRGPFISPSMYEDLFFHPHRQLFRLAGARGVPVVFHSDGDIRLLVPSFLREGVNAIQPLDALAGMDVVKLKEQYGDRLAFMGNVPNKTVLPRGTPGDVAETVKEKLLAGMGGGYILGSSHSIAGDVPPDNFDAMLEAARRYGRYPL